MENGCDDYEVSFLRKSKLLNHFRPPDVPDICVITQSQVVAEIPKPVHGRMLFRELDELAHLKKLKLF